MTAYLRKSIVVLPLALMLALASGCQLSSTQKNTLIGGTGGALAGAGISALAGGSAGVGALVGGIFQLYPHYVDSSRPSSNAYYGRNTFVVFFLQEDASACREA